MIVNLSNHPSSSWSDKQLQAASEYGEIVDLQFPQIHPDATLGSVKRIARTYKDKILKLNPDVLHIQGEQVFVFILVNWMRELGIRCVASTSKRIKVKTKATRANREFGGFRNYFL